MYNPKTPKPQNPVTPDTLFIIIIIVMALGEIITAVMICVAVATLCFTVSRVYIYTGWSFMVTVLLMLVLSSLVRVVERFDFT